MKRLSLSILALASVAVSAQVEVFPTETFDSGIPATWIILDEDGLTPAFSPELAAWGAYSDPDYYFDCAASNASYSPAGQSDDWLITPAISIPASGDMMLEWKCKSRWPGLENDYEVRMSIGAGSVAPADFTYVLYSEASVPTSWQWDEVQLPAAALGNDIHIAFREITDDGNIFCLEDVAVWSLHPNDIGFYSVYPDKFVEAGPQEIKGTVQNRGSNTITSYTLTWDDGSGPNSATISDVIAPWQYSAFTHPVNLNAVSGTYYDINVTATVAGDGDLTNGDEDVWISCVTSKPTKYVVGEERTGTWCGWCPRGAVGQANMESVPTWIGIAVHGGNGINTDPMEIPTYNTDIDYYIPFGFPTSGVDRVHTYVDPDDYMTYHDLRVDEVAPVVITVDAVAHVGLDVTVNAEFYGKIAAGDYRLACVVTEDNVTGTSADGYDQYNYYSFESSDIPLTGAGHDWQAEPNPVPAADMEYDHVARFLGDLEINGTAGSLPAICEFGSTQSFTYSFDPTGVNLDNCKFIGMLIDNETGEILQAGYSDTYTTSIEEHSAFDLNVYPNPSSDITYVRLEMDNPAEVSVAMFNTIGQQVYFKNKVQIDAGAQILPIDVSDLPNGIYSINITIGDDVETVKFSKR